MTLKHLTARHWSLLGVFALQLVCVLFFVGDSIADLFGLEEPHGPNQDERIEHFVVVALVFSLVFSSFEIYQLLVRNQRIENQLKAASGAFSELLEQHFTNWALTESERDVALLAIKGLDIAEISIVRNTKQGTIKAQLNAIYRKADVSGRPQLISLFVEELMASALSEKQTAGK